MEKDKGQIGQLRVASVVIALALGGFLLMLWPGLIALFFGALLLFQSCTAKQEMEVWSWVGVGL
jgi:hypothetical protein